MARPPRPRVGTESGRGTFAEAAGQPAAVALVLSTALVGCTFEPGIPADARLTCASRADCPPGLVCALPAGLCVDPEAVDRDAVSFVGAPTLAPGVATAGDIITLSFVVDEALGLPAVARLESAGVVRAFGAPVTEGDRHTLEYLVDGVEPQGVWSATVDLVDAAGNAAAGLAAGTVVIDLDAPAFAAIPVVAPGTARAGATVAVQIVLTEAPAAPPTASLVDARVVGDAGTLGTSVVCAAPSEIDFCFTFEVAGGDGPRDLLVDVADEAGNAATLRAADALVVDSTPPVLAAVALDRALARPGDVVSLVLEADEPLAAAPTVLAVDAAGGAVAPAFDLSGGDGAAFSWRHVVRAGEDGAFTVNILGISDAAGNALGDVVAGTVTFDGRAPTLVGYAQSAAALTADDTLVVTFSASEPLGEAPAVSFGGVALAETAASTGAPYVFALPLGGTGLGGSYFVEIVLADQAGNRVVLTPGGATVDARAPALVDVTIVPAAARTGVTAVLSVLADEPLSVAPVLAWGAPAGDPGFAPFSQAGFTASFTLPVDDATPSGAFVLARVTLVDDAGNVAEVDLAGRPDVDTIFSVDSDAPVVSDLGVADGDGGSASFSTAAGHDRVTVAFDVDEELVAPAALVVTVAGAALPCAPYQPVSPSYVCTYDVRGDEGDGPQLVAVAATDAAGNTTLATAFALFDFTAPDVVGGTASLLLTPPPGALVDDVTAIGVGGKARVLFAVDEALPAPPVVTAAGTGGVDALAFTLVSGAGTFFVFEHALVAGAHAQGARVVTVDLVDAAGNRVAVPLPLAAPGLVIDTVPPSPPTEAQLDRLVYTRAPWGAARFAGARAFRVEAIDAALEPGVTALVWDGEDTATAGLAGRAAVGATGGVLVELDGVDRPRAFVSQVDGAGNLDAALAAPVRNVDWIATMGDKVLASVFENPHRLDAVVRFQQSLRQPAAREIDGAGTDVVGGAGARVDDGATFVRHQSTSAGLSENSVLAPDRENGGLLLFGGRTPSGLVTTRIERFDHSRWRALTPTDVEQDGNPPPRTDPGFVEDPLRGRHVVFGGLQGVSTRLGDTWEWDGTSFLLQAPADPEGDGNPPARSQAQIAFDRGRGVVVLFSGSGSGGADTWEYDGSTWRRRVPSDPEGDGNPPARADGSLAYDVLRARSVLFGGFPRTPDTWEWNGASWARRVPLDPEGDGNPIARSDTNMAYDERRNRVVIHGGSTGTLPPLSDTWEWDGTSWDEKIPLDPEGDGNPPVDQDRQMGFDPIRERIVLYAGDAQTETWAWDGTSWQRISVQFDSTPSRREHAHSEDGAGRRHVVFGGRDSAGAILANTRVWEGTSWLDIPTPPDPEADGNPGPRAGAALAADTARGRAVMFGGNIGTGPTDELWEWNGTSWIRRTPNDPGNDGDPSARAEHALAYDAARSQTLLFGGGTGATFDENAETWSYNGTSWTRRTPPDPEGDGNPSARRLHAMAYDATRDVVVLFGGFGVDGATPDVLLGDTWEWDGTSWRTPPVGDPEGDGAPPARSRSALAHDPRRGTVVLFGGDDGSAPLADAWEWDGASWRALPIVDDGLAAPPDGRQAHTMAFDRFYDRLAVVGGSSRTATVLNKAFIDSGPAAVPAALMTVALSASGALDDAELESFAVEADAGASVGAVDGATALSWASGAWAPLASTSAPAGAPGFLEGGPPQGTAGRHIIGARRELFIAIAADGAGRGALSLDALTVVVRFRYAP